MSKIAYGNEYLEKGHVEDFYSQIEKFDSDLAKAFKTFLDENEGRMILADFIPEKENEDLRAARLIISFYCDFYTKREEVKLSLIENNDFFDECYIVDVFIKSNGSIQIRENYKPKIWFSPIKEKFVIIEKSYEYETKYIDIFNGFGEIYFQETFKEEDNNAKRKMVLGEENVTGDLHFLVLKYISAKNSFYAEVYEKINKLFKKIDFKNDRDSAFTNFYNNFFENYSIYLFNKKINSQKEYFENLLEEKKASCDVEDIENLEMNKSFFERNYDGPFLVNCLIFTFLFEECRIRNMNNKIGKGYIEGILGPLGKKKEKEEFFEFLLELMQKKEIKFFNSDFKNNFLYLLYEESRIYELMKDSNESIAEKREKFLSYLKDEKNPFGINSLRAEAYLKFLNDFNLKND